MKQAGKRIFTVLLCIVLLTSGLPGSAEGAVDSGAAARGTETVTVVDQASESAALETAPPTDQPTDQPTDPPTDPTVPPTAPPPVDPPEGALKRTFTVEFLRIEVDLIIYEWFQLTFSDDVHDLSTEDISIFFSDSGGEPTSLMWLSGEVWKKQEGDNKVWVMRMNSYPSDPEVTIDIAIKGWTSETNGDTYTITNSPQPVTYHPWIIPTCSFEVEQVGGEDGSADTEGLLVTFSENFSAVGQEQDVKRVLSSEQITITPSGIFNMDVVTDNNDEDPRTWFIPLNLKEWVKNGATAKLTIAGSENTGAGDHYEIERNYYQTVTIYRELLDVAFTAEQRMGVSLQKDTKYIQLKFFHNDVTGTQLTFPELPIVAEDISIAGATVEKIEFSTSPADGAVVDVYLTDIHVANGGTVKVGAGDFGRYHVVTDPQDVMVFKRSDEFLEKDVTLMSATQIGGSRVGTITTDTTEGVLLVFHKDITLSNGDITVTGATKGALTDYGDSNAKTWYVPLTDIEKDGEKITVTVGTEATNDADNKVGSINDGQFLVTGYQKEVTVYIDQRVYVTYGVEQIGGTDGLAATTGLRVTITGSDELKGLTVDDIKIAGATRNTVKTARDENVYTFEYTLMGSWDNGAEVTVTLHDWIGYDGKGYVVYTDVARATLYQDTRTHVRILSANGVGAKNAGSNQSSTYYGRYDDTAIEFTLSEPGNIGLSKDKISITGENGGAAVTISTAADALTYDAERDVWSLKLQSVEGSLGKGTFYMEIDAFGNYCVDNVQKGTYSKDMRPEIQLTAATQVGGEAEKTDSTGILLTFDREILPSDINRSFDLDVSGPKGSVPFSLQPVEANRNQVFVKLGTWNYKGTTAFTVRVTDDAMHQNACRAADTSMTLDMYRSPPAPDGRTLEGVSPRGLYQDSVRKTLTLTGELGGDISRLTLLRVRPAGDEDHNNWLEAPVSLLGAAQMLRVDVSGVALFSMAGDYEVRFEAEDGFLSEWRPISVYDNPVYSQDGYGILAIAQEPDNSLTVQAFNGETEMEAALGGAAPLLVFRGGVLKSGGKYQVQSDSVLNNVLTYFHAEGDETIQVEQDGNGDIKIHATEGSLKWKSVPITAKNALDYGANVFEITLLHGVPYKTDRLAESDAPVEIKTGINDFSVNFFFGEAEFATYKLYDGTCSVSGKFVLGLPDWLAGSMGGEAALEEMLLADSVLPSMKAEAEVEFRPGGLLGDGVSDMIGGGAFALAIDTLPETRVKTIGASGNLDIADMLYVEGELVMGWGEIGGITMLVPNKISFFGRIGTGGVPLVPPTIVAYINGFGGGIDGLADTVLYNFQYVPPLKIMAYGAVVDATGELFKVDKAEFKLGVGSFSAYAREAELFKVLTLEDVGYAFGITDSAVESKYGLPTVDTYFSFGGTASVEVVLLKLEGGLEVSAFLYGNYLSDGVVEWIQDCDEAGGFVKPSKAVRTALYKSIDFNGRVWASAELGLGRLGTLASASGVLALDKTQISGKVTGTLWPGITKTVGVTYNYKKGVSFDWFSLTPEEAFGDEEVTFTNVHSAGSYRPGGGLRTFGAQTLAANEPPQAKPEQIATIFALNEYSEIEIYKGGELYSILSQNQLRWFETVLEEDQALGAWSANYLIPEEGQYTFKAGDTELYYELTEITPLPEFESVTTRLDATGDELTTSWTVNSVTAEDEDIQIRLLLVNAQTGNIALDLTAPEEMGGGYPLAGAKTFTGKLPDTLESGEYYVSAELTRAYEENISLYDDPDEEEGPEVVTVTGYSTIAILNAEPFRYTNPNAPAAPADIAAFYIGNGAFEVTWASVSGADGYQVSVLDSDGAELPGITTLDTAVSSVVIQGGTVIGMDGSAYGLEFEETYTISVRAYKDHDCNGYAIPVLGEPGSISYDLPSPQIPQLNVMIESGNEVSGEEGVSYLATNNTAPKLVVTSDVAAVFHVSVKYETDGEYTQAYVSSTDEKECGVPLSLNDEGIYRVRVTAAAGEDYAESGVTISLDTTAPVLNVDNDSFAASEGVMNIRGFTELGASVTLNGEPIPVAGGQFEYQKQIGETAEQIKLLAVDAAGNVSERIFDVVYGEGESQPPTPPPSGGGNGGGSSAATGPKFPGGSGWTSITKEAQSLEAGETLAIDMNGVTTVPGSFLEAIAGKDVDVVFNMGGGFTWTVNGRDIPGGGQSDLSLGVSRGTGYIPAAVRGVDGSVSETQLRLSHDGAFAFRLTLTVTLDQKNAGHWANLFYYNRAGDKLEFRAAAKVAANGAASFPFDHASDYLIVVSGENMTPESGLKPWENPFADVKETDWFYGAVKYAFENGVMQGVGDQKFEPHANLTRAMLVQILWNLEGRPSAGAPAFRDVAGGAWYAAAIAWAAENGIVNGYDSGLFGPGDNVTREQMAVMLYHYCMFKEIALPAKRESGDFVDAGSISGWAEAAVWAMYHAEILSGKDNGVFDPKGTATRSEAAQMFMNLMEAVK